METALVKPKAHPPLFLKPIYQVAGAISLILRRQQFQFGLALLALLGIVLAVGLVTDAYFFSEAVDRVILLQELADFSRVKGRPPISTNVYIFPSTRNPLRLEDAERASRQIANILSSEVGLPLRHISMLVSSGGMMLQSEPGSRLYGEGQDFLGSFQVVYIPDVAGQIEIVAGQTLDESGQAGDVLDVWMHERQGATMGVQLGDTFTLGFSQYDTPIRTRLVGLWHAKDPKSDFWFTDPDSDLKDAFLVRRSDYIKFIQPVLPAGSRESSWYVILDDRKILPKNGSAYLAGFQRAQNDISKIIPGVKLNTPPLDPLKNFVQRSQTLTILLLSYNIPAYGILLYFLALTSGIIAQWQRKEMSILVSRGFSMAGVLSLVLLEQLILFVIGYPLGIVFGMLIARAMGYTASFLSFTYRSPLPISLHGLNIPLTFLALGISLVSRLSPALQVARQSVVTEEREWTRPVRGPFWYRYYLDLVLLLPTYYLYDQMLKRGSLSALIISEPEDIYRDPLLILVPALFIVAASLIMMRLFSLVMRLIDLLASRTPWITLHLALRQLGRQSYDYIRPLLLVLVSLALGVYTLSMAASLDQWLVDRMYYRVGADFTFTPQPLVEGEVYSDGMWIPAPEEFRKVNGVVAATRMGDYVGRVAPKEGEEQWVRFLAIDRIDFPSVAWFRSDFAQEPLVSLMNRLALNPEGVLVSKEVVSKFGAQIGAPISVPVIVKNTFEARITFTIVGVYDYFPTVYEQDRTALIGNMDYLADQFGFTLPHDIWLKLDPGASTASIRKAIPGKVGVVPDWIQDTRGMIAQERAKMERVGIFGTLTIGFLATAAMAILGLLTFSYASLRERVFRFAVLNAIGLTLGQITAHVIIEFTLLSTFGALAGVLIGIFASQSFIPFFRFTGERGTPLPPLLPIIADRQIITLGVIFTIIIVSAEISTITSALRRRIVRIK
jgi:putative ABC transport system permease protein